MPDPLQQLLAAGLVPTTTFPPTSRYLGVGVRLYHPAAGPGEVSAPMAYLRRRLCPAPDRFSTLYEHVVVAGDRRELLAFVHVGDAELWWRLADANGVIDPADLTAPVGRRVRVTSPEGVPGAPDG